MKYRDLLEILKKYKKEIEKEIENNGLDKYRVVIPGDDTKEAMFKCVESLGNAFIKAKFPYEIDSEDGIRSAKNAYIKTTFGKDVPRVDMDKLLSANEVNRENFSLFYKYIDKLDIAKCEKSYMLGDMFDTKRADEYLENFEKEIEDNDIFEDLREAIKEKDVGYIKCQKCANSQEMEEINEEINRINKLPNINATLPEFNNSNVHYVDDFDDYDIYEPSVDPFTQKIIDAKTYDEKATMLFKEIFKGNEDMKVNCTNITVATLVIKDLQSKYNSRNIFQKIRGFFGFGEAAKESKAIKEMKAVMIAGGMDKKLLDDTLNEKTTRKDAAARLIKESDKQYDNQMKELNQKETDRLMVEEFKEFFDSKNPTKKETYIELQENLSKSLGINKEPKDKKVEPIKEQPKVKSPEISDINKK